MATENNLTSLSYVAGADLSGQQFRFVKLNAQGQVVLAAAGEFAIGVLQNNPTSGDAATVAVSGITKVRAGGVIAVGAAVASDGSGNAKTAVAGSTNTSDAGAAADALVGSHVLGIHLGPGASAANDIVSVLLTHSGAIPTTAA